VGIHPIIKHTDTTFDKHVPIATNHNTTFDKHVPIATNHNTTALLEKKNWVLSFLMIYLLFPSSTPLAPSPKQLQPHKKTNKQTTR
jgi:hypothetical protein